MSKKIELLSPAKNLECGIAAVDHGADAVYIGAPRFGARAAAGNSLEDISTLVDYAHRFGVKIYVTVNTILYDDELEATERLIAELYNIGVDAILVQDMSILKMNIPPISVHASTQMDNRTPEKVQQLSEIGFRQVVLARELSLDEIKEIHAKVPSMKLEAFVHGALCVSYSGQCYASQYCFGRSANRGECAQFCRLKFNLEDSEGHVLVQDKHLLSLKDLCQIDHLEEMLDAGISSFKIEGRLKDVDYVKNVTAAYSKRLNEIISCRKNEYVRSSYGEITYMFNPSLEKSFNRGFTNYFLNGRNENIWNFNTPKSMGEQVGHVKDILNHYILVAGSATFCNGDGLCFVDGNGALRGFRVNRVENNKLYPFGSIPEGLRRGVQLFRNNNQAFEQQMSRKTAERKIPLSLRFYETKDGFGLDADVYGRKYTATINIEKQLARTPQKENIVKQLTKWGNTVFASPKISIDLTDEYFIPSSQLTDLRRMMMEELSTYSGIEIEEKYALNDVHFELKDRGYRMNISNRLANQFYQEHGIEHPTPAFEKNQPKNAVIMQCRHCIRFALGFCVKHGGKRAVWKEPLFLTLPDGGKFQLEFDCKNCEMNIIAK